MTQMSRAAIAPRQPSISNQDRQHPLFRLYQQHRSAMSLLLVEASEFQDWLFQYKQNLQSQKFTADARYPEFLAWMRSAKGGARRCPAGVFPHNFNYWLDGGRW
jgi:hypothetical protein